MKRLFGLVIITMCVLLSGCATTISSDVTAFHAWPTDMKDKSFAFDPDPEQKKSLEYESFAQLIRQELEQQGFHENTSSPAIKVAFQYGFQVSTVIVNQPGYYYDPFWYGPRFYPYGYWPRAGFYDPFWNSPPQQTSYPVFNRYLELTMSQATSGKRLYEVTVNSNGRSAQLAEAMPYMVHSAFIDFPGPSGVTRHIEMKVEDHPGRPTLVKQVTRPVTTTTTP